MITRIVKMTLEPENISGFKTIFYELHKLIMAFDGCSHVELMKDVNNECIYFTISHWRNVEDLDAYRQSYLFKNTWSKVKPLFSEKAEAWSLISEKPERI